MVLYIDDLDRCPPDKVLEVLEAVHLLLALELFIVIVGVDPHWLDRSLRHQYRDLGTTENAETDPYLQEMPTQYLEKIFQIPLTLPAMEPAAYGRLVASPRPRRAPDRSHGSPSGCPKAARRHALGQGRRRDSHALAADGAAWVGGGGRSAGCHGSDAHRGGVRPEPRSLARHAPSGEKAHEHLSTHPLDSQCGVLGVSGLDGETGRIPGSADAARDYGRLSHPRRPRPRGTRGGCRFGEADDDMERLRGGTATELGRSRYGRLFPKGSSSRRCE